MQPDSVRPSLVLRKSLHAAGSPLPLEDGRCMIRGKLQLHWQCPQSTRNGTQCVTQMVVNFFSQIIFKIAGD